MGSYGKRMHEWEDEQDHRDWNRRLAQAIRDVDEDAVRELLEEGKESEWSLDVDLTANRSETIDKMVEEYPY